MTLTPPPTKQLDFGFKAVETESEVGALRKLHVSLSGFTKKISEVQKQLRAAFESPAFHNSLARFQDFSKVTSDLEKTLQPISNLERNLESIFGNQRPLPGLSLLSEKVSRELERDIEPVISPKPSKEDENPREKQILRPNFSKSNQGSGEPLNPSYKDTKIGYKYILEGDSSESTFENCSDADL